MPAPATGSVASGYSFSMDDGPVDVACLCAAWCRTCDGYRAVFDEVTAELQATGAKLTPRWIDIEDEAELVGDLDVETFPTLLVASAGSVRFVGPLTPQPETLRRLLRAVLAGPAAPGGDPGASPEARALAMRLSRSG